VQHVARQMLRCGNEALAVPLADSELSIVLSLTIYQAHEELDSPAVRSTRDRAS
jgi:hypothetical protein